jgi:hypothetical protein
MAKDQAGHGSEAHREHHRPQVEHGPYGNGEHFHDGGHRVIGAPTHLRKGFDISKKEGTLKLKTDKY